MDKYMGDHRPTDHMPVKPAVDLPKQDAVPEGEGLRNFIQLKKLEIGQAYALESRNLGIGIWDGKEFHGIRFKFGDLFMDSETHWDLDDHYGTAQALRKLE